MEMVPVVSTNVVAVGYDAEARIMRVQYENGRAYDYHKVAEDLYQEMLKPFAWRRVGRKVLTHTVKRVND